MHTSPRGFLPLPNRAGPGAGPLFCTDQYGMSSAPIVSQTTTALRAAQALRMRLGLGYGQTSDLVAVCHFALPYAHRPDSRRTVLN